MKSIIIIFLSIFTIVLTSCNNSPSAVNKNSHTHADGSVHSEHSECQDTDMPAQESFKVEADTAGICTGEQNPDHDHHHDHSHNPGHKH